MAGNGVTASKAISSVLGILSVTVTAIAIAMAAFAFFCFGWSAAPAAAMIVVGDAFVLLFQSAWRAEHRARLCTFVEGMRSISLLLVLFVFMRAAAWAA